MPIAYVPVAIYQDRETLFMLRRKSLIDIIICTGKQNKISERIEICVYEEKDWSLC